ncbi:MAG: hypothetical protein ACR2LV_07270 [Solirubrobacteraceae bacterium]
MNRLEHRTPLTACGLLAILVLAGFASMAFAAGPPPVKVGVSPRVGGVRTAFVTTFIVPRVRPGRIVEVAFTQVKTTGPYPCDTGNYPVFHTPVGQRAHVTFRPSAGSHWCPGTYHVQVSSYNHTSRVLGTSVIVHVNAR